MICKDLRGFWCEGADLRLGAIITINYLYNLNFLFFYDIIDIYGTKI